MMGGEEVCERPSVQRCEIGPCSGLTLSKLLTSPRARRAASVLASAALRPAGALEPLRRGAAEEEDSPPRWRRSPLLDGGMPFLIARGLPRVVYGR